MNYEQVAKLLEAGFNADEIRTMLGNNSQNPQNNPQETEKTEHSEKQPEEKEPENTNEKPEVKENGSDNKTAELEKTVENLTGMISNLVKTIQTSNLKSSSFSKPSEADIETQVNDIMAGIIRPEREKGDK